MGSVLVLRTLEGGRKISMVWGDGFFRELLRASDCEGDAENPIIEDGVLRASGDMGVAFQDCLGRGKSSA